MNNPSAPYQLIQKKTGKIDFQAQYCKYYPSIPYCALFEEYPSEDTRVMVCRNVTNDDRDYGYRLCSLILHRPDSSTGEIGDFVVIGQVRSEQEATEKIQANIMGNNLLHRALG